MSYPYVFIHGMLGFGQDEKVNDYVPYWGMLSCDLVQMIRDGGGSVRSFLNPYYVKNYYKNYFGILEGLK